MVRFRRREATLCKKLEDQQRRLAQPPQRGENNEASEEMYERPSTASAPWRLVAGNFKWHARLEMICATVKAMEALPL